MSAEEQTFLRRVRQLEEEALSRLFETHYPAIYRYILRHVGHAPAAEDLAAEVFRRLLDQLKDGRGPDQNVKAWLYRVAYHLVVDDARRQTYRQHDELPDDVPHTAPGVEETAQQELLAEAAQRALLRLTDKQRTVLILRFLEGMSIQETAEIIGIAQSAAKALQRRGLASLRRELEQAEVAGDLI